MRVIRAQLSSRFARNVGWLGGAQLANRVFRLVSTVIVARILMPEDYGLAAIVLTAHECVQMLSRHGVVAKIIQAPEARIEALSQSAYWLNWVLGAILFVCQCAVAWILSGVFDRSEVILPICALGLTYFMLPLALVQAGLILRANRLRVTATMEAIQTASDVALTIVFALMGWGFWALVMPKVLVVPVWVVMYLRHHDWRPRGGFRTEGWGEILRFSLPITGVEVLMTLRQNLDYLLIGYVLGVEALGVYFFAFNAGLGISLALINALGNAFFPHLCDVSQQPGELRSHYFSGLKLMAWVALPMILLQASLAPVYLPIVFGEKWLHAGALPVLILICLSALPRPFAEAASQLLRTLDQPQAELKANIALTLLLFVCLLIGVNWGINGVAWSVLLVHMIFLPIFTLWAQARAFRSGTSAEPVVEHE